MVLNRGVCKMLCLSRSGRGLVEGVSVGVGGGGGCL